MCQDSNTHRVWTNVSLWPDSCCCCALLFKQVRCGSTLPKLLEQQSTTRASCRPQARMSSVWLDPTKPASATENYKSKYAATSSNEFSVVRPYRMSSVWLDPLALVVLCPEVGSVWFDPTESAWGQSTPRASIRPQARMRSVWFEPTEHAWATEHYKMEYRGTSSHEFTLVRPYRTHESLWPDTCSCCALLFKQVWCGSTLLNLLEQQAQQEAVSSHKLAWVSCGLTIPNLLQ